MRLIYIFNIGNASSKQLVSLCHSCNGANWWCAKYTCMFRDTWSHNTLICGISSAVWKICVLFLIARIRASWSKSLNSKLLLMLSCWCVNGLLTHNLNMTQTIIKSIFWKMEMRTYSFSICGNLPATVLVNSISKW